MSEKPLEADAKETPKNMKVDGASPNTKYDAMHRLLTSHTRIPTPVSMVRGAARVRAVAGSVSATRMA